MVKYVLTQVDDEMYQVPEDKFNSFVTWYFQKDEKGFVKADAQEVAAWIRHNGKKVGEADPDTTVH